ncbi:Uncharacterised protein [Capnocytophaga canimorsus]|nr:Uncharacterised protein [Capnocytophaga canimorsus]
MLCIERVCEGKHIYAKMKTEDEIKLHQIKTKYK